MTGGEMGGPWLYAIRSAISGLMPWSSTPNSDLRQAILAWILTTFESLFTFYTWVSRTPYPFIALFTFRYLRTIVHLFAFWFLYKPTSLPISPKYLRKDCTVIVPTIDPENVDFTGCVECCLMNAPSHLIIATVGRNNLLRCILLQDHYRRAFPNTKIQVIDCPTANKRQQIGVALNYVKTKIVVLLDDHVFWPSQNFLPTVLAPFEDDKVGAVGTNKRVRKVYTGLNMKSFWNMLGAIYLERHNFEIRATNSIDGGVFVVSGRTAAYRASILQDQDFKRRYLNERFFLGKYGPLNSDDDNFITRWVMRRGYDIKIQYCDDALVETTLGTYPKFLSQCLRWARTTWRSNSAVLFKDSKIRRRQPWCTYAVYCTSFVNFALFYDAALIYTLTWSPWYSIAWLRALCAWFFLSKMIKLTSYFLGHPQDLFMLPGYFVFAYFHSLIKLYALLTFWNTSWNGRDLNIKGTIIYDHGDDSENDDSYVYSMDSSDSYDEGSISHATGDDDLDPPVSARPPPAHGKYDYSKLAFVKKTILPPYSRRPPFITAWGPVSPSNPHLKPANLLDSINCSIPHRRQDSQASHSLICNSTNPSDVIYQAGKLIKSPRLNRVTPSRNAAKSSIPPYHDLRGLPTPPVEPTNHYPTNTKTTTANAPCLTPPLKMVVPPCEPFPSTRKKCNLSYTAFIETTSSLAAAFQITNGGSVEKSWTRGRQCDKLHSDACHLNRYGKCQVVGVFDLLTQTGRRRPQI